MADHSEVYAPADSKMKWFQEPLRDHTDLDGKISFALSVQPGLLPHRPDRPDVDARVRRLGSGQPA